MGKRATATAAAPRTLAESARSALERDRDELARAEAARARLGSEALVQCEQRGTLKVRITKATALLADAMASGRALDELRPLEQAENDARLELRACETQLERARAAAASANRAAAAAQATFDATKYAVFITRRNIQYQQQRIDRCLDTASKLRHQLDDVERGLATERRTLERFQAELVVLIGPETAREEPADESEAPTA